MSPNSPSEKDIFDVARKIASPEVRSEYLDQICAGNADLRARLKILLDAVRDDSFLQAPPIEMKATSSNPIMEDEGSRLGRYRLLQQIGDGGFGVVFMAEQTAPVRRKVALKIIKPGSASMSHGRQPQGRE